MRCARSKSPRARCALSICAAALAVALHTFEPEAIAAPAPPASLEAIAPKHADFRGEAAPADVRHIADWALDAGDHEGLPFLVIDKKRARLYAFSPKGSMVGAAPILLGRAVGDTFPPGVEDMDMYETGPWQRITPAGRFRAESYRKPNGQWILWIDYDSAIALHKVLLTNPGEERDARIQAGDVNHRRITYGCINVPVEFYDHVIHPAFRRSHGIVYVLPETRPVNAVFASYEVPRWHAPSMPPLPRIIAEGSMAFFLARADTPREPSPADRRSSGMKLLPHTRRVDGTTEAFLEADS
jgi:hypothetical protein